MNIRRTVGTSLVLLALASAALTAGGPHSNFVPGDFEPAAGKLGVQERDGYYDLGALLAAATARVEQLEKAIDIQRQAHEEALTDLQFRIARGVADNAAAVQAVSARLEKLETAPTRPLTLLPGEPVRRNRRATLTFGTTLEGLAEYGISVIYLATGRLATDSELDMPRTSSGPGVISWSWDCGTSRPGPALAIVTARTADAFYQECFEFRVE